MEFISSIRSPRAEGGLKPNRPLGAKPVTVLPGAAEKL